MTFRYSFNQFHADSFRKHIDGLVQDCGNSIANGPELLQSCWAIDMCYICVINLLWDVGCFK